MADRRIRIGIDVVANGADKAASDIKRVGQAAREATEGISMGADSPTARAAKATLNRPFGTYDYTTVTSAGNSPGQSARVSPLKTDASNPALDMAVYSEFIAGIKQGVEEELNSAKAQQKETVKAVREQERLTRSYAQLSSRALPAVMATSALTSSIGNLETSSSKVATIINGVGLAMQTVGSSVGGKSGGMLMAGGLAVTLTTLFASFLAMAIDHNTANVEKETENRAKLKATEEIKRQADAENRIYKDLRDKGKYIPGQMGEGAYIPAPPEELKAAKDKADELNKRYKSMKAYEDAMTIGNQASQRAKELKEANLTPEERTQRDINELRQGAKAAGDAAAAVRELSKGVDSKKRSSYEAEAAKLDAERNDLLKRANERLDDIKKDTKQWPELGMESVGAGRIGGRTLTPGQIAPYFNQNFNLNFMNPGAVKATDLVRLLQSAGLVKI